MTEILFVLFLLCLGIQVTFHQLVFKNLLSSDESSEIRNDLPSVSVIIASRNESKHLPDLLRALKLQDHPNMEVIFVNDRSADNSEEIIKSAMVNENEFQLINIRTLPEGWTGKKHALYKGIEIAKNEVLLFTDADCVPKSNQWASLMAAKFFGPIEILLGFSPYEKNSGWLNRLIQYETLLTGLQYLGLAKLGRPYMGVGRNWAIKRELYDLAYLKSMSHITGGDDDLMINRLATNTNTGIMTTPSSQTLSKPMMTWQQLIRQKTRHLSVGKFYHKKDKTLLGLFTLSLVFGWIFFFSLLVSAINPYLILTVFGLRSLSFYSIFARVGQKFDIPIKFWALPLMDLSYSIYYPVVGIRALSTKNIEWK